MKTKIASFLSIVALSLLTFATSSFADEEEGFYEKDHVRGFISIGADYRGMRKEFQRYVNSTALADYGHLVETPVQNSEGGYDTLLVEYYGTPSYKKFNDYYLGMHVNVGAQYKQFLTWFDFNFMWPQVSKRPRDYYTPTDIDGNRCPKSYALYDVEWFAYGADWMFGWKLFGENAPINLIPAVGFGFNLINFHFASNFSVAEKGNIENNDIMRDRFYSTLATTVNSELELRIELGRLAVGAYGGYRFIRYNDLSIEDFGKDYGPHGTDNVGDTYFLGLRLTWYFLSQWEKKQADKL
ncbi:hypothetical protein [Fibrobacter sp.]|uniref:hypothetical protein n=1 Tax=Fibrobacter sp. TaxID=35828 RepID=UPI003862D932